LTRGLLLWGATGTAFAASAELPGVGSGPLATILLSIILLACSAFFSASETALFSLQPLDLEEVSNAHGRAVSRLLARPRHTLASILIGNETVNITLSTLTAGLLLRLVPDYPWLNIVVVAPVLLLFGEVLPKTLAFRLNRHLAPRVAPVLLAFSNVVAPMRFTLGRIAEACLVITGGTRAPRQAELREAHLKALIDRGRRAGSIRPVEQEILHNVFAFGEHTVSHLMTAHPEVFTVNLQLPWSQLLEAVLQAGHSRVPVWQGRPDNIVGILLIKKLLALIAVERSTQGNGRQRRADYHPSARQIHKLLHPPRFVPSTKRADDLLSEFQTRRNHMAIVVNEHGAMVGVVTLDDLLNELVGEMNDETDQEDPAVTPIDNLSYRIRGNMPAEDFAERFHLPRPEGTFETVSGLVLELVDGTATKGTQVEWKGVRFTINSMAGQRITELVLTVEHASAEDEPTQETNPEDTPEEAM